jgi:hypothetical protein
MNLEQTAAAARRGPPPPLRWRSWPLEEGGQTVWLVTSAIVAMAALVGWVVASAAWSVAAGALLAVAAWRLFIPIYFEISHQGIFQEALGHRTRIAWRSVVAVEVCRDGLLFMPGDVLFPATRGFFLPWGRHRVEVLALVSYYVQQVHHDDFLFELDPGEGTVNGA